MSPTEAKRGGRDSGPTERLRYYVTGAIERGEAVAIEAVVTPAPRLCECGNEMPSDSTVTTCFMCYTAGWGD